MKRNHNQIGKGVKVEVEAAGSPLIVDETGCIGPRKAGRISLRVVIDLSERTRGDFLGLERQGEVHAILKRDCTQEQNRRIYRRTIEIKKGDDGAYVAYPANCFKLLEIYKNGSFRIWEVGIAMHGGRFYLVSQAIWRERAYRDGDTVVIPAVFRWESLRKVMFMTDAERLQHEAQRQKKGFTPLVPPNHVNLLLLENLSPARKYTPRPEITADGLDENQGRVKWWNGLQGMGAVVTHQGQARIHHSNLCQDEQDEFVSLRKGDVVVFDELVAPEDERSKFEFEAKGVRLHTPVMEELEQALTAN